MNSNEKEPSKRQQREINCNRVNLPKLFLHCPSAESRVVNTTQTIRWVETSGDRRLMPPIIEQPSQIYQISKFPYKNTKREAQQIRQIIPTSDTNAPKLGTLHVAKTVRQTHYKTPPTKNWGSTASCKKHEAGVPIIFES